MIVTTCCSFFNSKSFTSYFFIDFFKILWKFSRDVWTKYGCFSKKNADDDIVILGEEVHSAESDDDLEEMK